MNEEILKKILETLENISESMDYQKQLLEEMFVSRDELQKQRERALIPLQKYQEMMQNNPIMKQNPQLQQAMSSIFESLVPPSSEDEG